MSSTENPRPPLPPFDAETAAKKARMAEDAWNSPNSRKIFGPFLIWWGLRLLLDIQEWKDLTTFTVAGFSLGNVIAIVSFFLFYAGLTLFKRSIIDELQAKRPES